LDGGRLLTCGRPDRRCIIDLPFDLFRNEMMLTLKPVPDATAA
jgi:hypothetical protein